MLARLRAGLIHPDLAEHFAEEVLRALARAAIDTGPDRDALAAQIAKADLAIDRLLNLLEQADDSASLLARLKDQEADRSRMQQALATTQHDALAPALPTVTCHGNFPPPSIIVRPNLRRDNETNEIHRRTD
ncbi:hypothetical protein SAMN05444339_12712, partial [Loktanella atrilutea]